MATESLVFLSGKRTPFGTNGGALRDVHPTELSLTAARAALEQADVQPQDIQHTIWANVLPSTPDAIYIPRHVGLKLGVPQQVPALGINRLCGSGFQVIIEAYHQMLAGETKLALVGGVENMSMAPYLLLNARWGMRMGNQEVVDQLMQGLVDSNGNIPMAVTAENLAVQYKIAREETDAFALRSQKLAAEAQAAGRFSDELAPVVLRDRKGGETRFEKDEHPRPQTTPEVLAKLRPVFKKDGQVTAGNASGIVDGAAAMVVAIESEAKRRGVKPLGRLVSYGIVGCDPTIMGIGPAPAARQALERAGLKLDQMDLIEVNEAFASQTIAVERELKIPRDKLNVNGGAIAIGHPLGASGTRITMTALYELRRRNGRYALVSACIGGGQGVALVVEAMK